MTGSKSNSRKRIPFQILRISLKVWPSPIFLRAFFLLMISALCVVRTTLRITSVLFFKISAYFELFDATYYLNHYYFISCCAFLMIFIPAHHAFRLTVFDGSPKGSSRMDDLRAKNPVYPLTCRHRKNSARLALEAMPLSIWLKARTDLPLIGPLLDYEATAYLMSWGGMLFDVLAGFLLLIPKTRTITWIGAVFHALTAIIFPQIGVFPYAFIVGTLVYFPWKNLTHQILSTSSNKQVAHPQYTDSALRILTILYPAGNHSTGDIISTAETSSGTNKAFAFHGA